MTLNLKCPECGSAQIRTNTDKHSYCRRCGKHGPRKQFEEPAPRAAPTV